MKKVYTIHQSKEERERLHGYVHMGRVAAQKRRRSQILLLVDQGEDGPALKDAQAAVQVGVTSKTIEAVRKQCVLEGIEAARRKTAKACSCFWRSGSTTQADV